MLQSSEIDSQEEHSGATHQGPGEPRLFPSHNTIPSQDHLTPALQLLLQLGCFLSLNTKQASKIHSDALSCITKLIC